MTASILVEWKQEIRCIFMGSKVLLRYNVIVQAYFFLLRIKQLLEVTKNKKLLIKSALNIKIIPVTTNTKHRTIFPNFAKLNLMPLFHQKIKPQSCRRPLIVDSRLKNNKNGQEYWVGTEVWD